MPNLFNKKRNRNRNRNRNKPNRNKGFTLLEVMVAITLTALVLGNLLALQSQSSKLSFKAQKSLSKVLQQRAYLNAAWLSDRQNDHFLDEFSDSGFSLDKKSALKKPKEQGKATKVSLESFTLVDKNDQVLLQSVRTRKTNASRL